MSEYVLVLSDLVSNAAHRLRRAVEPYVSNAIIIPNVPPDSGDGAFHHFVPDDCLKGYEWVMPDEISPSPCSAWSRALHYALNRLADADGVWFIDSKVALSGPHFELLQTITASESADFATRELADPGSSGNWYWWKHAQPTHRMPHKSFNAICRCSGAHLSAVAEYLRANGSIGLQEICLASVAVASGLRVMNWDRMTHERRYFGEFHFQPDIVRVQSGICHPVADDELHQKICDGADGPTAGAFADAIDAPLCGLLPFSDASISLTEYRWISRWFRANRIERVIEFGPGVSSLAIAGAGSELHSYGSDELWLKLLSCRFGDRLSLQLIAPGNLPAIQDLPFIPDLMMIDGPPCDDSADPHHPRELCAFAMEVCGRFLLHDSNRADENAALREYDCDDFEVIRLPSQAGMALVTDLRRHPAGQWRPVQCSFHEKYSGLKNWGWYLDQFHQWHFWLATPKPVRALEIGSFDGISANVMLDGLFTHPESWVDCIDPYTSDPTTPQVTMDTKELFNRNREIGCHEERIRHFDGRSLEVLSWMINEQEYFGNYDFIYVDGSHLATDVMVDAVLSWKLLKVGGIMIFDDYGMVELSCEGDPPSHAINSFLSVYREALQVLESGWRLVLLKTG
jgi:predicted O-methyltransferase YrrM